MIELATGAASGSVYDDRILPRGREGIVIKTHLCNRHEFDRAVHLVRHPLDAIESYYHWKRDIQGNIDLQWREHALESAAQWREHTLHWSWNDAGTHGRQDAAGQGRVLCVRYEDLRARPAAELARVLEFLGCTMSSGACDQAVAGAEIERMRALHPTLGQRFFRQGIVGAGEAAFDETLRGEVMDAIGEVASRFGYDRTRP